MTQVSSPPERSTFAGTAPVRWGAALAVGAFCLDQISKFIVIREPALQRGRAIYLLPFFDVRRENNTGVSMNFLDAGGEVGRWLLVGFAGAICICVGVWLSREKQINRAVALGLILGGALGNIVDRIQHGFVVDFADLHFGEWRPFLIFNIADGAITIGVLLLLAVSLLAKKYEKG